MSVRVGVLTERVEAAPGEIAAAQVALRNEGASEATVRIRVVGLDGTTAGDSGVVVAVPGGTDTTCFVPVPVPAELGIGDHAAGLEVHTDRPGDRPSLAAFTVSVASVERVELTPVPATVRGLRRAKLRVDVANYEPVPVELELRGESPDADVQFKRPHVRVLPGQHALVSGRVKGPRRWAGEPTQHTLVLTGQGRSSATTSTAVFIQRPLFARRLRGGMAALLVIALWLGAVGGFVWWWRQHGDAAPVADGTYQTFDTDGDGVPDLYVTADGQRITAVDTDGDGVPDLFTLPDGQQVRGVDTDGDGDPDAFTDLAGNPVADPRSGEPPSGQIAADDEADDSRRAAPSSAVVRGTVQAAGDVDGIAITLTPISLAAADPGPAALTASGPGAALGAPDTPATPAADDSAGDAPIRKLWPARLGVSSAADALTGRRQSEALRPLAGVIGAATSTTPQPNGVWLFTDVALRQSYELTFAKPGFDTQSFVVTPPEDGSATEIDVELEPATGSIAGRVTGPGGPLGGVEITVTDGTLTFTTTTATVGEVGTWSVEEVSTPGVYTITAERRGYGTEVRQIELTPGQQFTGADLAMRAGVGSISGRVLGPDGLPLGGVTITASTEDTTFTTSSHTEGDIGAYHLPQLDIPATYTVTVALDGYLTQTRRVAVGGAVGGVDFTLTHTTLRLTGMVTSQGDGRGIPNAGLTLSTGDLTFKVATAGGANSGSFAIEDLPPGTYTVRVEHYLHDTSTQFVTLTAGVPPAPLEIALRPNNGIAPIGTGSLVVEVVDPTAETAARREIKNATVRLLSTQNGELVRQLTQEAFDFELTDIPVGTYTIEVSAPRYNPAPPRRVSIGLSQTRVQVELMRLGQASGRIVDSITGAVLNDYFVSLYRQPERQGDAPVFTLPSRADGTWQTPPDSLIPGTYRVEVTDNASPKGYLVRTDQLLDSAVVGATPNDRFMRFVLPADATDPVVVADIEADRYPVLRGTILKPAIDGTDTELDPIDSSGLSVTITCTDADGPYTVPLADGLGGAGNDSFELSPEDVDAQNLTGTCTITAQHPGRTPATVTLNAVDASDGTTLSDRHVQLVLAPPAPAIGGTVFWLDGTTRNVLSGVAISARAITAFPSREGSTPATPTSVNLATTSNGSGSWDLNGQLYGVADYQFVKPGFSSQTVTLTVDDSGLHVPASATVGVTDSGRIEVQLLPLSDHVLSGMLTVHTTASPVDFSAFTLTATGPGGTPVVTGTCTGTDAEIDTSDDNPATPTVLEFEICNAMPGTWSVTVDAPAGFEYFGTPPPVVRPVDPAPNATAEFPLELVQLARVRLTILDSLGAPLDVTPTVSLADATTTITTLTPSSTEDHVFSIERVPVAPTAPAATDRTYTLRLLVPGYDSHRAEVNGVPGVGVTALPVTVRAGTTVDLEIRLPELGSLTGTITGRVGYDPGALEVLPIADLQLTAVPVDINGNPRDLLDDEPPPVIEQYGPAHGFRLLATPGHYKIVAEHPNYFAQDDDEHPDQVPVDTVPGASTEIGVFLVANDVQRSIGQWELAIRTGEIDLRAVEQLNGAPVLGATYQLYFESSPTPLAALADDDLAGDGHALIDDLLPGTYRLEVRKYDVAGDATTDQVAFPSILTIVIGRSTSTYTSSATVIAPLPPVAPTISGQIAAVNSLGDPVPLPIDANAYQLRVTYPIPQSVVTVDGSTTQVTIPPGQLLDDDCVLGTDGGGNPHATCAADIVTSQAGVGIVHYSFQGVPAGVHPLAWDTTSLTALGYTVPPTLPTSVAVTDPSTTTGPTFTFGALDVTVNVELAPDDQFIEIVDQPADPDDGVQLDGQPATYTPSGNSITLGPLPPRVDPYALTVTTALHTGTPDPITVPVTSGASPSISVERHLTPSLSRITGLVQQCSSATICSDLASGGKVELLTSANAVTAFRDVSGPIGTYTFDVDPGTYWIRVTQAGHAPVTEPVIPAAEAGKLASQPLRRVDQLATVEVTIANWGGLDAPDITLRVHGGSTAFEPASAPSGSPPKATFVVPPGDYDVVVSEGSYGTAVVDLPNSTLGIGVTTNWSVELARRVNVHVDGAGGTNVTVKLFLADDDVATATAKRTLQQSGNSTFVFDIQPTETWAGEPLKAQVTAPGFRTQVVDVGAGIWRSVTVGLVQHVQLSGTVTSSESVANTSGTGIVRATSPGVTDIVGNVVDGIYTLSGLYNNPDGTARAWTVTYDKPGVGTVTSTAVSVSDTNTPASPNPLAAVPKQYDVSVTVTGSGGAAITGATVMIGGAAATESATTPGTYIRTNVNETFALSWSVDAGAAWVAQSGTTPFTGRTALTIPVNLVSRTLTVTVLDGTSGATGATFEICTAVPGNCMAPDAYSVLTVVPGGTGGVYTFVAPTGAGTYRIRATAASKSGTAQFTVNAAGAPSTTNLTINL